VKLLIIRGFFKENQGFNVLRIRAITHIIMVFTEFYVKWNWIAKYILNF